MIKRDYARCGYKPGFGDRLKLSRHNCKCRIDVLAKLIKVSTKTVIAWEKNEAMPDLNQAILAARCLGVSLDFLLRAIPEEYGPKEKALMRAYRESVDKRDEVDDLLGLLHVRRPVYLHHMDTVEDLRARRVDGEVTYYTCLARENRKAFKAFILAEHARLCGDDDEDDEDEQIIQPEKPEPEKSDNADKEAEDDKSDNNNTMNPSEPKTRKMRKTRKTQKKGSI